MGKVRGNVVVVETVYHQPVKDQPKAVDNSYMQRLTSDEQMYGPRRVSVGEMWTKLDYGWIAVASVLVLKNELPSSDGVYPTKEITEDNAAKILELGIQVGDAVVVVCDIPRGQSVRLTPRDLSSLRVRCRRGETFYVVSVFPR